MAKACTGTKSESWRGAGKGGIPANIMLFSVVSN
jgi:hypothetical protein